MVISWLVADDKESFDLLVNESSPSELAYLDPTFKLVDDEVRVCEASIMVNGLKVIDNAFESSPGFLTHKVLDKIGEIPVS